jgi:ABC-2 type transport system ATP-binding protein
MSAASTQAVISVSKLSKTFASGLQALKNVDLDIRRGEIFALLGPNGAGKTTLISAICGIVNPTEGTVTVDGHDIITDFRAARSMIGLVPQELTTDAFETVWGTVSFSRGLFGKKPNPGHLEKVLKDLSLWNRKDSKIITLSGGMKRRLLIAKALSHEPQILFLDEPTAGVDVELRQSLWSFIRKLNGDGHTIILTTHYLEEAEALCGRIAMLKAGRIVALDTKQKLLSTFAGLTVRLTVAEPLPGAWPGRVLRRDGQTYLLRLADYAELESMLAALREARITIIELSLQEADLEQVFLRIMARQE